MSIRIRMPAPLRIRTRGPSRLLGWLVALLAIALVLGLAWQAYAGTAAAAERRAGEREDFIARLEGQLHALRQEATRLAERAKEHTGALSESAREELTVQRQRLAELQAEAETLLADARERSDENWQEARPHLRKSWEQFREGLHKLLKAN